MAVSTTYLAALAAPLVAFGVVFADAIIGLLYGEAFAPAAFAFALCLSTGAFSTLSLAASGYLLGSDRQRTLMFVVLGGVIVKVALDISLVQRYGLTGAVAAYGATSVLIGTVMIGIALYHSGARLEWGRMARVLVAALLAAGIAWAVRGQLAVLPGLVLGGILLSFAYVAGTLLLGFWSAPDLQHIQALHSRMAGGRPAFVGRILGWAARRAEAAA